MLVYIEYWKFLKYLKKKDDMINLSERMMEVVDNPTVPTDLWIDAHDIRFKSLLMKGGDKDSIEKAIEALKRA